MPLTKPDSQNQNDEEGPGATPGGPAEADKKIGAYTVSPRTFAIKSWRQWRLRRRLSDAITLGDAAAVSFGLRPECVKKLSKDTRPSLAAYNGRLKFLLELADAGIHLTVMPSQLDRKNVEERLVPISQFVALAKSHDLQIPQQLLEIENQFRAKSDLDGDVPVNDSESPEKEKPTSVKIKNLEITLGAVVLLLAKCAKSKKPVPSSLLAGERLNQSEFAKKIEEILKEVLTDGDEKRGHSVGAVRRTISSSLEHFPTTARANYLSSTDNEGA